MSITLRQIHSAGLKIFYLSSDVDVFIFFKLHYGISTALLEYSGAIGAHDRKEVLLISPWIEQSLSVSQYNDDC